MLFFFSICMTSIYAQNNQWTWIGGENNYTPASYGVKGVADLANRPGIRLGAANWKDTAGNFWLFGGSGSAEFTSGLLNDLWKYDPVKKSWTWVSGDSISNQKSVYGIRGIASPANKPGAVSYSVSWTDALGNFWMYSNVLWKYNPAINQWVWINGDTAVTRVVYGEKGVGRVTNNPGQGTGATAPEWTDTSGNLWLYRNVLWKYNIGTDMWTWMHGDTTANPGVYGSRGVPNSSNTPGARSDATSWTDSSGKFWLFGGYGPSSSPYVYRFPIYTGNLSDLWNYDPKTNMWTWISGSQGLYATPSTGTIGIAAPANSPGARSSTVSWTDSSGNLWLFGGAIFTWFLEPYEHPLNDVWKYDPVTTFWTCYKANLLLSKDTFIVKGMESPVTSPALRYGAAGWTDASGNLWVFGGGNDYQTGAMYRNKNDLLKYNPKTNLWSLERESNDSRQYSVYGTKGIAGDANKPGGRFGAAGSMDSAGNLWLFGGLGYKSSGEFPDVLNDLWKRDTANKWTWVSGVVNSDPFARTNPVTWTDGNGRLWLFGGVNNSFTSNVSHSPQNDVWNFDNTANQWKQISANNARNYGIKGQPAATNKPSGRSNAVSWMDKTGKVWLFGGNGYNDVWNYDPSLNIWTWMSGDSTAGQPAVFGIKGIPDAANKPEGRLGAVSWSDTSGNAWIFGGQSTRTVNAVSTQHYLNDLWKYSTVTNLWTWVSGDSSTNQKAVYGMKGIPDAANKPGGRYGTVSWMDTTGRLWLFGGVAVGGYLSVSPLTFPDDPEKFLNDLWNYDPATSMWTWVSGDSSINQNGLYDRSGAVNSSNKPGARAAAIGWKDRSGNFWLMGGRGYGVKGKSYLNDIWKFSFASPALPVKFLDFSATLQNKEVALNWSTAEEKNCAYYIIQRSRNGRDYDSIGSITIGNSYAVNHYLFRDHNPFAAANYYRLKQVDLDGKYTYSTIKKVIIEQAGFSYTIMQNPVRNEVRINLQSEKPVKLQLVVRDAIGHLLIDQKQQVTQGGLTYTTPVKNMASGTYFLTVTSGKTSVTKMFIKR